MSVFEYIVIALAMGINLLVVFRPCAEYHRVRLTYGLFATFSVAIVYCLLFEGGMCLGHHIRFDSVNSPELYSDVNGLVYLGLMVVVAIKLLAGRLKKNNDPQVFDISRYGVVMLLAFATGVNVFLVGLAVGFEIAEIETWKALVPLFVIVFLLGYLSVMLGRQKKAVRSRRWVLISVLLLLVSAIFRVV